MLATATAREWRTSYCSFTPSPAYLAHCVEHPPTGSLPRLFYVPCFARTTLLNCLPTPARILRTRRALCLPPSDLVLLQALACLTSPRIDVRPPVPELSVVAQVRTMTSASRPQARVQTLNASTVPTSRTSRPIARVDCHRQERRLPSLSPDSCPDKHRTAAHPRLQSRSALSPLPLQPPLESRLADKNHPASANKSSSPGTTLGSSSMLAEC